MFKRNRDRRNVRGQGSAIARISLFGLLVVSGILNWGCASSNHASIRKANSVPWAGPLKLVSQDSPEISDRTRQSLRTLDLEKYADGDYDKGVAQLAKVIAEEPTEENYYVGAELSYVAARRAEAFGKNATALEHYSSAVAYAYFYLFECSGGVKTDGFDPRFRQACDIYNESLESAMRFVKKNGHLKQNEPYLIKTPNQQFQISLETTGRWRNTTFQDFKFVSDFEVDDLKNQHRQYGLGVPIIAECKDQPPSVPGSKYFPPNVNFALTAFVQVKPSQKLDPKTNRPIHTCQIVLYDPMETPEIEIHGQKIPLEADISTPLAYLLDTGSVSPLAIATYGLIKPGESQETRGIYMLEPYDPRKVPVMMVHGLWSSPTTWMEMFNDLRAQPEIRKDYQFWLYLYPTGQPFWISAAQFRKDLAEMRADLDPNNQALALNQMVLVGHSMGGLVSRMQTIESQNDFWNLVSKNSPSQLRGAPEDTESLKSVLFFQPDPSIRRVITMGTPHRGSKFANPATQFLGRNLIRVPGFVRSRSERLINENPDFFTDTELLKISTSIDSLSPESPVLPEILDAPKAPWVKYHTVIGVVDEDTWLGYFSGKSDGVVAYDSARLDEAVSELVVSADHNTVHRNPSSVLEVRRILREHVAQLRQEYYSAVSPQGGSFAGETASSTDRTEEVAQPVQHLAPVVSAPAARRSIYTAPYSGN